MDNTLGFQKHRQKIDHYRSVDKTEFWGPAWDNRFAFNMTCHVSVFCILRSDITIGFSSFMQKAVLRQPCLVHMIRDFQNGLLILFLA